MTWPPIYALFQSAAVFCKTDQEELYVTFKNSECYFWFSAAGKDFQKLEFLKFKKDITLTLLDMGLFALRAEGVCETSVLVV